ncbi:MAG: T9SS type A sorting domain-containing protein [Lewinellaceae bacterium]|nr:T9SS type A sorting domain-containing protein [Lewinellaceae bacterium]
MTHRLTALLWIALLTGCGHKAPQQHEPSEAGEAFRYWDMARTFPDGRFYTGKYSDAMQQMQLETYLRGDRSNSWEAIGPRNIGGRTLCLAIHPQNASILWMGSASGGLWKSVSGGLGANAWERVETGFPLLGVSAIAIDPANPDVMYVGTGEVYNVEFSMPNVAYRTTRGTYGIGILKSTDGGQSWSKSLDWAYGDLRGVQDIKINPLRPQTVYAATSEGLLRSYNAGASWQKVHDKRMAVDIEINPQDTAKIFVTHGSLNDEDVSGIYRSVNAGASFQKLTNGLPATYTGKTLITIHPAQTNIMYASIGNVNGQDGLYKTTDGGSNWTKLTDLNVCSYQGWYSHDVVAHPTDPDRVIWVGIDGWRSLNGGVNFTQVSQWSSWFFGQVPAGGPEGPPIYIHADIHRAYWPTNDPQKIYVVTDGGLFVSQDGGESWEGRNGGYQTQQFYANLGNSATDPLFCIGGMQDNSTAIYTGSTDWTRVLGGDGECAAVNAADDNILYGSSQYLYLYKSTNRGQDFYNIGSNEMYNEASCFNAPFECAPSNASIMYAGGQSLFRSDDGGENWIKASNGLFAGGDYILTMAIHPNDPDIVYASTVPQANGPARVFRYNNGAVTQINGLPNRFCMDIAIHPSEPGTLYAVFSGFNTQHVWRSTNSGNNWTAVDNGLPDVPVNTVLIDPLKPEHVYIGNDLGVWLSTDAGGSWELYSADAPNAMLAMHLSISADRKLRVATHGLGVWQTSMAFTPVSVAEQAKLAVVERLQPNPAREHTQVVFSLAREAQVVLKVVDTGGKVLKNTGYEKLQAGTHTRNIPLSELPPGMYGVVLESTAGWRIGKKLLKQ